jgi:hypothetical protein
LPANEQTLWREFWKEVNAALLTLGGMHAERTKQPSGGPEQPYSVQFPEFPKR